MKLIPRSQIEAKAQELVRQADALRVPVPIHRVAHALNLRLEAAALGEDVSGVLLVENGRGTIGYNSAHPRVRQRFTIAHEIAHFVLHQNEEKLFIDKRYTAVYWRDAKSASGEHLREVQANRFAASLLMPKELLLPEIEVVDFDFGDEVALSTLAERFQVSAQAMSLRLASLDLFHRETH